MSVHVCRRQCSLGYRIHQVCDNMIIVGLTGGISTGKSTVTSLLRDHRLKVLDCDEIAHTVTRQVWAHVPCYVVSLCLIPHCVVRGDGVTAELSKPSDPKYFWLTVPPVQPRSPV